MVAIRKDIGELLLEKQIITPEQLAQAREAQKASPGDIGKIITDLGYATAKQVMQARALQLNIPFVDLAVHNVDPTAVAIVPENIIRRHRVIPVMKKGNRLIVAMSDTHNLVVLDDLRSATRGLQVIPALAMPEAIEEAIVKNFCADDQEVEDGEAEDPQMADVRAAIESYRAREELEDEDPDAVAQVAEQAPIIRVANTIIQQSIRVGASDIHIEPDRMQVRIRYRIDGVLHEEMTVPKYIQGPLISRFKIMADMNIAERRIPQDGRIPVRLDGKDYDLRVNCLPTIHGEKICCRILDKGSVLIGLTKLGFSPDSLTLLEDLIVQPNGMFLTTGPTGSGKTTTNYSVLNKINSVEKNIITIEDPVEYQLAGISQVQVHTKAGLTFGSALRAFLRQDPDIIMVGEMRDLETAEIAVEAALTGHLVLSTLHTNNAPSAVIRLMDMGVAPYLISATVIAVLAQRLARKVCPNCKEEYQAKASELRPLGYEPKDRDEMVTLARGRGCELCRHTGLKGRLGIYELLCMNEEIGDLVSRSAPVSEIRAAAKAAGMKELRDDGLEKVLAGVTTIDEVKKVVFTAGS